MGVVGLGREGLALSRFLASVGARVLATDDKPLPALSPEVRALAEIAELRLGGLSAEVLDVDTCFVSPGVPLDVPMLARAVAEGVPLWNEPGLLLWLCPGRVVGVTGSSGKSTTAALTAAMAEADGQRTYLGGNIGRPLIESVGNMRPEDVVVLELSSFQLELVRHSPAVAAITNITPNHLDRHRTMEAYTEAKTGVFRYQTAAGVAVLNADDHASAGLAGRCPGEVHWFGRKASRAPGAYLVGRTIVVRTADGASCQVCAVDEMGLIGEHNVSNALAACALGAALGLSAEAMAGAARRFQGLPHRLEKVAEVAGVVYYNDSIATTPERSLAALRAVKEPVVLLAGGRDKHLPWEQWVTEVAERVRAVVAFGEAGAMLEDLLGRAGVRVSRARGLAEALALAASLARPGDAVLLSPGGTSYDEFRDFEARGEEFRRLVLEAKAET
ncbi:MAG: UDP-N-acetylmuramoyl-L-alanine--D-glutamate ligase [Anaerolineae bacterium]|nr:UDP-N-acetylmuramoyl-L-alanine--D-glutamate ligase [Anaerolineae bacterium]